MPVRSSISKSSRKHRASDHGGKKKKSSASEKADDEEIICGDDDTEPSENQVEQDEHETEDADDGAGDDDNEDEESETENKSGKRERSEKILKQAKRDETARAKMRGYRLQATRAGIGKSNAIMNITGLQDVRRAAKFCPQNLSQPSYSLDEFRRRLALSKTRSQHRPPRRCPSRGKT